MPSSPGTNDLNQMRRVNVFWSTTWMATSKNQASSSSSELLGQCRKMGRMSWIEEKKTMMSTITITMKIIIIIEATVIIVVTIVIIAKMEIKIPSTINDEKSDKMDIYIEHIYVKAISVMSNN